MNTTEDLSFQQDELPEDRTLVIVDDDRAFQQRLVRAMEMRGFDVRGGHSVAEGIDLIRAFAPAFAVVDMRLEDGNGLDVIAELSRVRPDARAIVLTGYGNIATAVTAVKIGAVAPKTGPLAGGAAVGGGGVDAKVVARAALAQDLFQLLRDPCQESLIELQRIRAWHRRRV